jgi:hypothetical protein
VVGDGRRIVELLLVQPEWDAHGELPFGVDIPPWLT